MASARAWAMWTASSTSPGTTSTWSCPPPPWSSSPTDGLIDQVGGPRGITFGKKRVRELLLEQAGRTPAEINSALLAALQTWQGEHHRRDDLTFFCFRT